MVVEWTTRFHFVRRLRRTRTDGIRRGGTRSSCGERVSEECRFLCISPCHYLDKPRAFSVFYGVIVCPAVNACWFLLYSFGAPKVRAMVASSDKMTAVSSLMRSSRCLLFSRARYRRHRPGRHAELQRSVYLAPYGAFFASPS